MSKYRKHLPQIKDRAFITDGGLETTLLFHDGMDLPLFAAFTAMKDEAGTDTLRRYYRRYAQIAHAGGTGFLLETPTWRASPDWGDALGYETQALAAANRDSVALLLELRPRFESAATPVVVCGDIGPRGDGYSASARMSSGDARAYHAWQIDVFADTGADMVAAYTLNYIDEAIGIALAASGAAMPVAISFTLETDGRLPSGEALGEAIGRTDEATGGYPAYYMINCAHPTHFADTLARGGDWLGRIRGLRANASKRSHAELDNSPDLDTGDPDELGREYRELAAMLPQLSIVGGCCGTDHRHVEAVQRSLAARRPCG